MKYKCIKSFAINKYDEDGRLIENEQHIVEAGEIYESNDKHSMIGGEIHLDNVNNKSWIELSQESLNEFFAEIWTREEILKAAKPILFNTDMVRAILDGRKTVTRRLANKVPEETHRIEYIGNGEFECHWGGYMPDVPGCVDGASVVKAPFNIGDILYVRESFCEIENNTVYKADIPNAVAYRGEDGKDIAIKWKPSIHMPKDAARVFLIVKNVRLERLKDMVLADVLMEGIEEADVHEETWERWHNTWDSTIKKSELDKYGCEANPWVFVIQFERIMQN